MMLNSAVCVDRVTPKILVGNSPYKLVYGKETRMPISDELLTVDFLHQMELLENKPLQIHYEELMELEELRDQAHLNMEKNQKQMKKNFYKKFKFRVFNEGYIVLKWDVDGEKPWRCMNFDTI